MRLRVALAVALSVAGTAQAMDNGVARSPPMGWVSNAGPGCRVTETAIRAASDAVVATGLAQAGYRTVVLDGCWRGARDSVGQVTPELARFPSGIAVLADQLHARGLLLGLAADPQPIRPTDDAARYAAWGVDYLTDTAPESAVRALSAGLRATGRPIVLAVGGDGSSAPWLWARVIANSWRIAPDSADCFDGAEASRIGVLQVLDRAVPIARAGGPGGWNDLGVLHVGDQGMSAIEQQAQFSLWAMLAAPLLIDTDVTHMAPDTRALLTNAAVIAIDQDPKGSPATLLFRLGDAEVWSRPLIDGSRAVLLLNRGVVAARVGVTWSALGVSDRPAVRDLWRGVDLGTPPGGYAARVPAHGVMLLQVTPR